MANEMYRNAFKEVYIILQNTEQNLVSQISPKFLVFIKQNMNINYQYKIDFETDIDRQKLLPETENILSLIYRKYWATEEEKKEFIKKDRQEFNELEELKRKQTKDIYEIFEKRQKTNNNPEIHSLPIIYKKSLFQKIIDKLRKFFLNK